MRHSDDSFAELLVDTRLVKNWKNKWRDVCDMTEVNDKKVEFFFFIYDVNIYVNLICYDKDKVLWT